MAAHLSLRAATAVGMALCAIGLASGVQNTFRQLGLSAGVGAPGATFTARLSSSAAPADSEQAFADALNLVLLIAAGTATAGALAAVILLHPGRRPNV